MFLRFWSYWHDDITLLLQIYELPIQDVNPVPLHPKGWTGLSSADRRRPMSAHLLQGRTRCEFIDGIVVVTSGYLSCCSLSVVSNHSARSLLTSTRQFFLSTQLTFSGGVLFPGLFYLNPENKPKTLNILISSLWWLVWTAALRLHHI